MINLSLSLPAPEPIEAVTPELWARLALVNFVLGISILLGYWLLDTSESWVSHAVFCVASLLLWGPVAARAFLRGFGAFLADHRLMLVTAYLVYNVLGAALLAFGDAGLVEAAISYYDIDQHAVMRVDAINALGLSVALAISLVNGYGWVERLAGPVAYTLARLPFAQVTFAMLLIGAVASVGVLAVELARADEFVSGLMRMTSKLAVVAVFLGAAASGPRVAVLRAAAVLTALWLSGVGLLMFSKADALLPLIAFGAGLAWAQRKPIVLMVIVLTVITMFNLLGDLTITSRQVAERHSSFTLVDRAGILTTSRTLVKTGGVDGEYSGWTRICYAPAQSAAMAMYDQGDGGDAIELLPWLFVPRFLFPYKPEITRTGREFYVKLTGNAPTSSTGQGVFASGYYNAGWTGWLLASVICGWVIGFTSRLARVVLQARAAVLVVFPLLGLYTAFRIDGEFVADYAGIATIMMYALVVLWAVLSAGHRFGSDDSRQY